jgi:hypothetical protein
MDLWDFFQQREIQEIRRTSSSGIRDLESRVGALEEQIERQALVNTAMFEILVARLGLTKEDVAMKVAEVDLRDGIADGKLDAMKMHAGTCGKCGRVVSRRYARCLYCETGIARA